MFFLLFFFLISNALYFFPINLSQCHLVETSDPRPCWSEPNSVPECLLSSLEAFEWVHYEGTEEEKKLVAFILRSARCLKKVTICSSSTKICCCCCWFLAKKKKICCWLFLFFFCLFAFVFFKTFIHSIFCFSHKGNLLQDVLGREIVNTRYI